MLASHLISQAAVTVEMPDIELKRLIEQLYGSLQQRNRSLFAQTLETLSQALYRRDRLLWRTLLKWTGNKTLQKPEEVISVVMPLFDSLQIDHIAGLKTRLLAPLLVHTGQAATILQKNTGMKTTSDFIKKHLPHLEYFQEDRLRHFFRKSFQKLIYVQGIVRKIDETKRRLIENPAAQENLTRIQNELKMWALQFQFKTAKLPIMDQSVELHLSFLDYLNDNIARYYRGDGGAVAELYLNFLQQSKFPCLAPSQGTIKTLDKVGIIAFSKFSELLRVLSQKPSEKHPCQFITINNRAKWPDPMPDFAIVDVSRILAVPLTQADLQEVCQFIQKKVAGLPKNVFVGGALDLGNDIGIYILFCHDKQTGTLLEEMETYQGAIGGYPDVGLLRRALVESQFPLDQLVKQYPFRDSFFDNDVTLWNDCPLLKEIGFDDVQTALREVRTTDLVQLEKITNPTRMTQIYQRIVSNFLAELATYVIADSSLSLHPAHASIHKIKKRVQCVIQLENEMIEANVKFQKIFQEYCLMMEEMLFLMIYLKPASPLPKLKIAANELPFVPADTSAMKKYTWFASSGMASYVSIFRACAESHMPAGRKIEVALLQGCYFEVADEGMLRDYLSKTFHFQQVSLEECGKQHHCDILCLDLYPNYAPLLAVQVTPVVKIVQQILSSDESRVPLSLILDTSTTIFWDREVTNIIKELTPWIEKSKLNLVLVSSLAKYIMCGLDKTPGGISQLYYQQLSTMQTFDAAFSREFLSPEGALLTSIFLLKNREQIDQYVKIVFQNTDYIYDKLKRDLQTEHACLQLGHRQSPIPILAFHFHRFLDKLKIKIIDENLSICTYLLYYYIAEKAQSRKLPLMIRPSFGFPHAALTECHTALRCTIGIEDQPILDSYADLLLEINRELEEFIRKPSVEFSDLLKEGEIKNFIEERQAEVVSHMHDISFRAFIAMLHKMKH